MLGKIIPSWISQPYSVMETSGGSSWSAAFHSSICRPANRPAFGGTVPLFCQMSRVPLNHGNVPLFVRSQILRCRGALTLMQITQLNVITEIPFDFSQKYQTLPRPNRRATVYFGTQLISVGCILLKKSQCGPCQPSRFLPASPAFLREISL